MMKSTPSARLREARIRRGFRTAADAIRNFGWVESTYRSYENGTRPLGIEEATAYGRAFGVSARWLLCLDDEAMTEGVPVIADAAIGVWRDKSLDDEQNANRRLLLIPKSPSSDGMRFAVRVSDDSINKLVPAGAFVICKPWSEAETLSRGRYVYIEQTRGDLVERSVRIVEGDGPGSRLRTNSTVPALSSSVTEGPSVRIIGSVIGGYFEV